MMNKYNRTQEKLLTKELQEEAKDMTIKYYHVAYYDRFGDEERLSCYDEDFYEPDQKEIALSYLKYADEHTRIFVCYEDETEVELFKESE